MTSDSQSESGGVVSSTALLGTVWRHKKKGGIYRLTQTDNRDNVYLEAETKGCRSTWKYTGLLTWDYEQVPNSGQNGSNTAKTQGRPTMKLSDVRLATGGH